MKLEEVTGRPLDEDRLKARLAEGDGPLHRRIPRGWGGGRDGFARVLEDVSATEEEFRARLLVLAAACASPVPRLVRAEPGGPQDGEAAGIVLFPADPGPLPGWSIPEPAVQTSRRLRLSPAK